MSKMKGRTKDVIGLFVDGLDVKLAHLSQRGTKVVVQDLRSATLATRMAEHKPAEVGAAAGGDMNVEDVFGSVNAAAVMETAGAAMPSDDNSSVLLSLLASYNSAKYSLSYSLAEPAIYYHVVDHNFGLRGTKLKRRLLEELKNLRAFQPSLDAVDTIPTDDNGLLCIVREDGLSLVNALEGLKSFLGGRLPLIAGIDSADVSLMNMVRSNYRLAPEEVSVIVYVGAEFTRLIFMRGDSFYQFAPILGEGYDSANLPNTVYSRLLLEQDNLGVPHIHRIILAGESHRIELKNFLMQQLPDLEVDYLVMSELDMTGLSAEQQAEASAYAVAIGAAWRFLDQRSKRFYRVNLLPDMVREGQRVFKLAWHGYMLLGLLFLSTLFFTWQISVMAKEIKDMKETLALKQGQQAENQQLSNSIESLQQQLNRYQASLALYDSLVPGSDRWSRVLTRLSHGVEDLNSVWITDLNAGKEGKVALTGFTVYRKRIPRMAALFDNSVLKEVNVLAIREEEVYKYTIDIPAPPAGQ